MYLDIKLRLKSIFPNNTPVFFKIYLKLMIIDFQDNQIFRCF